MINAFRMSATVRLDNADAMRPPPITEGKCSRPTRRLSSPAERHYAPNPSPAANGYMRPINMLILTHDKAETDGCAI